GSIIVRIGRKKADFSMVPGSRFFWQHHVLTHGHGKLTVFDNGRPAKDKHSRALILHVDTAAMHVTLRRAYVHPGTVVLAATMGSAQTLPDGGMFVGWGDQPRFSQFFPDGRLLLDGIMAAKAQSYRAFAREWKGHPTELPAAAARRGGGGAIVYASWNGATDVASWTVLAGRTGASLSRVGSARRSGFETAIAVSSTGPYFAAQANDVWGRPLATSQPVTIALAALKRGYLARNPVAWPGRPAPSRCVVLRCHPSAGWPTAAPRWRPTGRRWGRSCSSRRSPAAPGRPAWDAHRARAHPRPPAAGSGGS